MAIIGKRARFQLRRFWETAGLPLLLLVAIAVTVLVFLLISTHRSSDLQTNTAATEALKEAQPTTLEDVLQRHAVALGGVKPIKALRTFVVTGKLTMLNQTLEMSIAKRLPDSYRVQARSEAGRGFIQVAHDKNMWLKSRGEWEKLERNPDDRYLAGVHSMALRAWQRQIPAELEERDPKNPEAPYVLTMPLPEGGAVRSYINSTTFLEDHLEIIKDGQISEVQYFTDYRAVQGLLIPHNVRTVYPETGEERVFVVETAILNGGLPSTVFTPGED